MDCSILSPQMINTLNFALSFIPWIPATFVFMVIASDLNGIVDIKYPGYDNSNIRTALAMIIIVVALSMFFIVWWSGLLLTKDFRCVFL